MTEKERLLKEIKELQEQVEKMDDGAEVMNAKVLDSKGETDHAIPVEELSAEEQEYKKLLEDLDTKLEEIGLNFRRDTYKEKKKGYDMGAWKSEKDFVEKVVKAKHFEDFAVADGFNLEKPSDAVLPQYQALRDEIASKSIERTIFDSEVGYHSLMAANHLSGLGPVGEAVGLGVGSVFGAITGAVEVVKYHFI